MLKIDEITRRPWDYLVDSGVPWLVLSLTCSLAGATRLRKFLRVNSLVEQSGG